MKPLYKILLIATIAATTAPNISKAQNDLPLYHNVISGNVESTADTTNNAKPLETKNNQKTSKDSLHLHTDDELGEMLRILQRLYLAGKYDDAIKLSQDIHDNYHLAPEDEADRHKYTIASLKEMEYNEQADSMAKVFLGKNPFYKVKSSDPVPFKDIISNYYTAPQFSIWLSGGQALPSPVLDTVHVIIDTINPKPEYDGQEFSSVTFQLGLEYHPWKFLSVAVAPTYTKYKYARTIDRTSRTTFNYEETDQILSVPLRIEGYLFTGEEKWVPSLYLGAKFKYIFKATYNAYNLSEGDSKYVLEDKELDLDDKNQINFAILGGIRLSYNYRRITIFGDLGLAYDLKPFNNPKAAMSNNELAYSYMYIPDIFHIIEPSAMIGIKVNLKYKTIAKYGYGH
ncbi:MAG: hypothetical protein K6F33_07585 [Bacteroidales bacterium]|nr:hypothetical protein [Bacteroidales bacterium]